LSFLRRDVFRKGGGEKRGRVVDGQSGDELRETINIEGWAVAGFLLKVGEGDGNHRAAGDACAQKIKIVPSSHGISQQTRKDGA
jgi:hypothetical protein